MNGPSFLCGIGLHWRCSGICYPVGLPARPCECGLCRHKNVIPSVSRVPTRLQTSWSKSGGWRAPKIVTPASALPPGAKTVSTGTAAGVAHKRQ